MLSFRDPVRRPARVVVAGVSGVGKSTLAGRISDALNLPSPIAVSRVVRRTITRSRTRLELWNGNTEPGLWHAVTNREGIIRWALTHQRRYRRTVPVAGASAPADRAAAQPARCRDLARRPTRVSRLTYAAAATINCRA